MRFKIFALPLIVAGICSLLASPAAAKPSGKLPVQRIIYMRRLPAVAWKRMPQGAKSCFAGTFKLTPSGPNLLLHLYTDKPPQETSVPYTFSYSFAADIFDTRKTKGANKYRFIKHFLISYESVSRRPKILERFRAQLLWLDPKERRKPIIKFTCFGSVEDTVQDNALVVFPTGLSGETVTQNFVSGWWRSSGSTGQSLYFDGVDETGLLEIKTQEGIPTNEIPQPPPMIFKWDGNKFKAGPRVEWNGKEWAPVQEHKVPETQP